MIYEALLSNKAKKTLKQMDSYQAQIIVSWIRKNLDGCDNPRLHGKALACNLKGYWRYRVGLYRLIAEIDDTCIKIDIVHQREVYNVIDFDVFHD